jgi:acid phosphatase
MARHNRRLAASLLGAATTGALLFAQPVTASAESSASTPSGPPHIMVIVEENQGPGSVIGDPTAPYINSLAGTYASATNWFGVQLNSINDYLELVSGSNQGWPTTGQPPVGSFAAPTVVDELAAKGIGSKAYMEDMPSACYTGGNVAGYMNQHNPFVWFSSPCNNRVVPFAGNFVSDLNQGTMPPFSFVVPNRYDDMHDGTVSQGDDWLHTNLPTVLASSWYANGGVVIVTWDEGGGGGGWNGTTGGQVPTLVIAAGAHGAYTAGGNHYGTLRAIEEAYGVGLLGNSADAANGDLTGAIPVISRVSGQRYVTQVYQDLLGRSPDAGGLSYWSALIDAGQPRYPIALSLTSSTEYVGDAVQAQYSRYLRRPVDGTTSSGGEGFWVGYIAHGATYEQLAESLIASDEYFNVRAAHDNTLYVTTLYQDILGRAPDPAGLAYWVGILGAGGPRAPASASILTSAEGYQDLVRTVFQTFLRHQPDSLGLAYWTGQLQSGLRDEDLIASIIGSDEYLHYAAAH